MDRPLEPDQGAYHATHQLRFRRHHRPRHASGAKAARQTSLGTGKAAGAEREVILLIVGARLIVGAGPLGYPMVA